MNAYLIKRANLEETFLKVGVTKKEFTRDRHYFGKTKILESNLEFSEKIRRIMEGKTHVDDDAYPDIVEIWKERFHYDEQALFLEAAVINEFQSIQYWPKLKFTGKTECFVYSPENEAAILKFIKDLSQKIHTESGGILEYALHRIWVQEEDPIKRYSMVIKAVEARKASK